MDRVDVYRKLVKELIIQYAQYKPAYGDIEMQPIFDLENDHYQLMAVGWNDLERIHGCVFHIDIKDGRVWIQRDNTDVGIANELVDMGVPKEDIVLAYHAPYKRKYTGFAEGQPV
jgi:hypothetical protein